MNKPVTTIIELSEIEAKSFIRFQKHRAVVELLESIGAFDMKSGSVTINFSRIGGIVSVEKHEHFIPNQIDLSP